MFSPNFGHNQSGVWGFFFKMIKNSSLFFLRKLQSYINLHQEDAVSGMLWCVCVYVHVCVSLSYGFTEGGEAKWDPAALQHLTCRKWEGGEWRSGGVGTTWSSSLLFIAQGHPWWSQTYFTGETPSQPNGSMHFDVCVQWRLLWDGGKQEEADGGQQSLFVPSHPLSCRPTLWGQKTGCSFTISTGLIHQSSDHSFNPLSVC